MVHNTRSYEHIFRAYDIRGIIGKDLLPDIITKIGIAYGLYLNGSGTIALGFDARTSSRLVEHALISGVISTGVSVANLGLLPIPLLNFYISQNQELKGGVMITASHNPPEYNGIRFRRSDGTGFTDENDQIKRIFFEKVKQSPGNWENIGSIYSVDLNSVIQKYLAFVKSKLDISKKISVVVDCGNGAASVVAPYILRKMGVSVISLNCYPDGTFPGRPSDPLKGNLSELRAAIISHNADFGIAYDGDADRVVFLDEKGNVVLPEISGIIFAKYLLSKNFGKNIVANVSCSMTVDEEIQKMGGYVHRSKVGDVFVAQKCKEVNAILGIESSAHYFFPAYGILYDDAIFGSLLMSEIVSNSDKPISNIVREIPQYPYLTSNIECPDALKFKVVSSLIELMKMQDKKITTLDGLKVIENDGWILIRPSNTEPLIRITVEGRTNDIISKLKDKYISLINAKMQELKKT